MAKDDKRIYYGRGWIEWGIKRMTRPREYEREEEGRRYTESERRDRKRERVREEERREREEKVCE